MKQDNGRAFFERAIEEPYEPGAFAWSECPEKHPLYRQFVSFLDDNGLRDKHCLEVGVGRGGLHKLVSDFVGMDLVNASTKWLDARFVQALATALPFPDNSFDVVWSNYVLEHVAEPETMLSEIMRVLKPGGHLFISAAWQAGPWLSTGYPVRPWSDFDWKGKLIKASVPIRGSVGYRAMKIGPQRLARLVSFYLHPRPSRLRYRKLHPSYEKNWMPDATAACSVEPFEVYLWYVSRGATCLNYPTSMDAFLIRTGPLTFRMPSENREPSPALDHR